MKIVYLVEFAADNKALRPTAFHTVMDAMKSWTLSYWNTGHPMRFVNAVDERHRDYIRVFHNEEEVGTIRAIDLYSSPTHL